MRIRVWVDGWQLQCCGTPFSEGDTVGWTLSEKDNDEWLETVLGRHVGQTVSFSEEHHGGLPDDASVTSGVVRRIQALRCRYTPTDSGSRTLVPVAGSGALIRVSRADGCDPSSGDLRFNGYVVDLDVPKAAGPGSAALSGGG